MISICNKNFDENDFIQSFLFIIDHPKLKDEKEYEYNRSFLKKLKLKGDSVGWCRLKNPTAQKLNEIFALAKDENVSVRGEYELVLNAETESEWYSLEKTELPSSLDICERKQINDKLKEYITEYKNYLIPNGVAVFQDDFLFFRKDVKLIIESNGFTGGEFLWSPDCGKYKAKQYFTLHPSFHCRTAYINYNRCSSLKAPIRKRENFSHLTESLQLINKNCKTLSFSFPIAVNKTDMPEADFCEICFMSDGRYITLVSKKLRNFLVSEKFLKADCFTPVICGNFSQSQALPLLPVQYVPHEKLSHDAKNEIERLYRIHSSKTKPKRTATKALAVKSLKTAVKNNPCYFSKKANDKQLSKLPDNRLMPYYKVTNGGTISDEYRFLSINEATLQTESFRSLQEKETVQMNFENTTAFAVAADGELVLLFPDGKVKRYQTGEEDFAMEWNNLEAFFFEETE